MSAALTGIERGLYFCTACLFSKGNTLDQSEGVVCCYALNFILLVDAMDELILFL